MSDMIRFEDMDKDGRLGLNEFYAAFSKLYSEYHVHTYDSAVYSTSNCNTQYGRLMDLLTCRHCVRETLLVMFRRSDVCAPRPSGAETIFEPRGHLEYSDGGN